MPTARLEPLPSSETDVMSRSHVKAHAVSYAWALPSSPRLTTLDLSSCEVGLDGGDELCEALRDAPALAALDLRGNRLPDRHELGADARVDLGFQRPPPMNDS